MTLDNRRTGILVLSTAMLGLLVMTSFKLYQSHRHTQLVARAAGLRRGTAIREVEERIPEPTRRCTSAEMVRRLFPPGSPHLSRLPGRLEGPVLAYRVAGIDHLTLIYFDGNRRLSRVEFYFSRG